MNLLLLLMTLIWGTNYSIIKSAFHDIDPQAFNALRMIEASILMLAAMVVARRARWNPGQVFYTDAPLTRRDLVSIALLGIVGHCVYQYAFIGGIGRTSVANTALLLTASPVLITIVSAVVGHDRVTPLHWVGVVLSMAGIYIVVGHGARLSGDSWKGDAMIAVAVCCWAIYTVGSRTIMQRHSPVGVTALSMVFGTVLYVPLTLPYLTRVRWANVSAGTWVALVYSAAFAICVAYVIWYAAVREIGSAKTAVYSNLLPIVAMLTAVVWLHEPLSSTKIVGAGAVLAGVALTRLQRQTAPTPASAAPEP
jgi:drug/metabolite transporter (DMT)-like permease